MNILEGKIKAISSEKTLSLVELVVNDCFISGIVLDNEVSSSYLVNGNTVNIYFKETEVILSKNQIIELSIDNILPCVIKKINVGKILAEVILDFKGCLIKSILPAKNFLNLNVSENEHIFALINYTDVILSSEHD